MPRPATGPGPEAEYRAFLSQGRFMIQRSVSTGQYVFYPRVAAPGSGATDLEWVEASGLGRIYSITVNRARTGDYNIALVELDEGPRLMTRIEGVETAAIGTRVRARIAELGGEPAVVFDVVAEESRS
ncbi:MAG TPA: OB-fold domain-containing protein [Ferrovibrio sp.]|uniref:Zn-ribbon domain-containing OB-fold protein n=1 Tax=Ferrovibrio sp. TaxID=1917215 RepID=UPI002B4B289E|nr:OB-fold domain-containing protein [Ferrovibrio sp.]HLT76165.1 OB-fold domain-containing protein [Ferrovibrio sp.]